MFPTLVLDPEDDTDYGYLYMLQRPYAQTGIRKSYAPFLGVVKGSYRRIWRAEMHLVGFGRRLIVKDLSTHQVYISFPRGGSPEDIIRSLRGLFRLHGRPSSMQIPSYWGHHELSRYFEGEGVKMDLY